MTDFGSRIKRWREERGLSQAQFAELIGISRNYVSQLERGVSTNLSLNVARRISDELGMDLVPPTPSVPESLRLFAEQDELEPEDVRVLAAIEYRGQKPQTVEAWRLLHLAIRSTTGKK